MSEDEPGVGGRVVGGLPPPGLQQKKIRILKGSGRFLFLLFRPCERSHPSGMRTLLGNPDRWWRGAEQRAASPPANLLASLRDANTKQSKRHWAFQPVRYFWGSDEQMAHVPALPRSLACDHEPKHRTGWKAECRLLKELAGLFGGVTLLGRIDSAPEPRRRAGRDLPAPDEAVPRLRGAAESGVGPEKEGWSLDEAEPDPVSPGQKACRPAIRRG